MTALSTRHASLGVGSLISRLVKPKHGQSGTRCRKILNLGALAGALIADDDGNIRRLPRWNPDEGLRMLKDLVGQKSAAEVESAESNMCQ